MIKKIEKTFKKCFLFIETSPSKKKQIINNFTINLDALNAASLINAEIDFIKMIFSEIIVFET